MKTVEEMRVAVLAECETVCPKCYKAVYKDGIRFYSNRKGTVEIYNETYLRAIDVSENMGEGLLIAAYRILGLEARDAVEDEREEMMKTVDALSAMVSVDPVAFADLQARNAALVAALEEIRDFATDEDGEEMDAYDMGEAIGLMVELALTTNTEKGGANE